MTVIGTYILTDQLSEKFYVGSSQDVHKRIKRHIFELKSNKHHCYNLQLLWNKNNCKLMETIIPTNTKEEALALEQDILDRFRDSPKLLNICLTAKCGDNLTRNPRRQSIIDAITKSVRFRMSSLSDSEKVIIFGRPGNKNGMWGKTHTAEVKALLSEKAKNRPVIKGNKISEEQKKILSELGKKRIGALNGFFGKKHSEETRKRLSEVAQNRTKQHAITRKVIIDGKLYPSVTQASRETCVSPAMIIYKIKNQKYIDCSYYEDERSTTIENTSKDGSE